MIIQTTCLSLWDLAISRQWGGSVGASSPNLPICLFDDDDDDDEDDKEDDDYDKF